MGWGGVGPRVAGDLVLRLSPRQAHSVVSQSFLESVLLVSRRMALRGSGAGHANHANPTRFLGEIADASTSTRISSNTIARAHHRSAAHPRCALHARRTITFSPLLRKACVGFAQAFMQVVDAAVPEQEDQLRKIVTFVPRYVLNHLTELLTKSGAHLLLRDGLCFVSDSKTDASSSSTVIQPFEQHMRVVLLWLDVSGFTVLGVSAACTSPRC